MKITPSHRRLLRKWADADWQARHYKRMERAGPYTPTARKTLSRVLKEMTDLRAEI